MAKFPIERAPERLDVTGRTAVRADLDVRTGAGAVGQAVAGLGGALFDLGLKYDLKQANTQFSEYKRKAGEDDILLADEISRELDSTKHDEIYKRHTVSRQGFMPTNRRAIQAANIWNNQQAPIRAKALADGKRLRVDDNWQAELFKKQAAVATSGNMGDFEAFLARGIIIDQNNPDEIGRPLSKLEAAKILANTRKMAEVGTVTNLYGAGKFEEARTAARAAKLLSPIERESLLNTINAEERSLQVKANTELKAAQNAKARELLVSLWDNTLNDATLRDATKDGLITFEKAKGLREALTSPKAFNLAAYIKVKNAVNSYERGRTSFDDALGILVANASMLGDQGKALTDKLFAMPNKNEADWEEEGIDYIQSQILEKDIFGRFYGTPKEQTAALEARLAYDVALEDAERKDKPIEGRDKLIKAHEIMLKYRPEKKEKPPAELEKGLGTIPFVDDSDIDKAIRQARENLGEKATPQQIKEETLRLLK